MCKEVLTEVRYFYIRSKHVLSFVLRSENVFGEATDTFMVLAILEGPICTCSIYTHNIHMFYKLKLSYLLFP